MTWEVSGLCPSVKSFTQFTIISLKMYAILQNVKVVFLRVFLILWATNLNFGKTRMQWTFQLYSRQCNIINYKNNQLSRYVNLLAVLQLTQSVTCKGAQKHVADRGRVSEPNCLWKVKNSQRNDINKIFCFLQKKPFCPQRRRYGKRCS